MYLDLLQMLSETESPFGTIFRVIVFGFVLAFTIAAIWIFLPRWFKIDPRSKEVEDPEEQKPR